ncbi:hypothetical protein [Cohnella kolymensis]|uniref:hypothetical protein n=1 Tax=Cohnella kolymensis TaxID=1590652 RepID=UPI000AF692E6|nr:hypothetical protein [Cohnella kolymensis]
MVYSKNVIEKFSLVTTASVADAVDQIVGKTGYMDFEIKPQINNKKIRRTGGYRERSAY